MRRAFKNAFRRDKADMKTDRKAKAEAASTTEGTVPSGADPHPQEPDLYSTEGDTGIKVVADPSNADLDIVFVHGLTGNRETTWTHRATRVFWPELLAQDINTARIMTFGYDADVVKIFGMAGRNNLRNHGTSLASDVSDRRNGCRERPIIFIAHSLGGLVCEQALLFCGEGGDEFLENVVRSTRGIIFMGTPHAGADLATWGITIAKLLGKVRSTNSAILGPLQRKSDVLIAIEQQFQKFLLKPGVNIKIYCFFEEKEVVNVGLIVSQESATLSQYPNQSIAANHMDMTKFSGRKDMGYQKVLSRLQNNIEVIKSSSASLDDLKTRPDDEKRKKCHRIFSAPDYQRYKDRNNYPVKGTCQWFLRHPNYTSWRDSKSSSILWVSADSGSGKSVLSKLLVDKELQATKKRTTCYFFFKDDNDIQKTATGALCALLHQVFAQKPELLGHAVKVLDQNEEERLITSVDLLWEVLTTAAEDSRAGEIVCILDALDECGHLELKLLLQKLCSFYDERSQISSSMALKFLVTSRPLLHIENEFSDLSRKIPAIRLAGEEHTDEILKETGLVIEYEIEKIQLDFPMHPKTVRILREEFTKVENRTYLWLMLIFDLIRQDLQSFINATERERRFHTIPKSVDTAYTAILNKSTNKNRARKLLKIMCAATRPLSVKEVTTALLIQENHKTYADLEIPPDGFSKTYIRNLCGLFVSVIDGRVFFLHQTAKEFLMAEEDSNPSAFSLPSDEIWKNSVSIQDSSFLLASICMRFISLEEFKDLSIKRDDIDQLVSEYEFLEYSAENLAVHFRAAVVPGITNLAESLRQQGKYAEAAAMHLQTLQLQEKVLGKEHPDTLRSMNNLAESLRQQGKYIEAESIEAEYVHRLRLVEISEVASVSNTAKFGLFSDSGYTSMQSSRALEKRHEVGTQRLSHPSTLKEEDEYCVDPLVDTTSMANESFTGTNVKDLVFDLLLEVIRDDSVLKPLFQTAIERMGLIKAVTNLENFLKGYCILLRANNPDEEQSRAIQFLRHRARAFAEMAYEKHEDKEPAELLNNAEERSKAREARKMGLENVQRLLSKSVELVEYTDPNIASDIAAHSTLENVELSDTEDSEWPKLPEDLQKIKLFLTQGQPMQQLRISYKKFANGEPLHDWNREVKAQSKISPAYGIKDSGHISTRASALIKATADTRTDSEDGDGMPSAADRFVQNPQLYFDSINHLQSHIFDLGRQLLGEIKQDSSVHVLCLPTVAFAIVPSSNSEVVEQLRLLLERNLAMVCVIIQGLRILTEIHFCNLTYNIIVANFRRDDILRVIPIAISDLELLEDLSEEALAYCSTTTEWTLIEQTISDLGEATVLVLQHLGLVNSLTVSLDNSQYRRCIHICKLLYSTCSVLFIGLISFIKSHVTAGNTENFQDSLDELQIESVDGPISLRPRRLACLDSFIKHPIWTFSHGPEILPPTGVPSRRYYLSTLLADFGDLWGPLSLVYLDKDRHLISEIRVRGGVIRRSGSVLPSNGIQDETRCHWYSWMDRNFYLDDKQPLLPISTLEPLIIGAGNRTIAPARRNERNLFHIHHTCHCKSSTAYAIQYQPFELKTKIPSWEIDARTTQMSAGKYVTLSYGQTWKFSAGWTLKDVIVDDWLEGIKNDSSHHPKPYYLDYLVVLEISRCTGHTRRISLWSLFKNQTLKSYLHDVLDPITYKDFDLLTGEILRQEFTPGALFVDVWGRLRDEAREVFKLVVKSVLDNLRSTGIGEDGHLQSWDITSRGRIDGRKTDPSWRSMVKDDVETATFAIITDSCMEYTAGPPLDSTSFSQTSISQSCTILYTKVCITATPPDVNDYGPYSSETHTSSAEQESLEVFRKEEFNQWRVASSRSLDNATNANRLNAVSTARAHHGIDPGAISSIYDRQSARKRAINNRPSIGTYSTAIGAVSLTSHNRQAISNSAANLPSNQALFRNRKFGLSSAFCQPLPSTRLNIMCDPSLRFINGQGQNIGTLTLESQEQTTQINLTTASEGKPLRAMWAADNPGPLASLRAKRDAMERRVADWAKNSKGTLPWIVDHFSQSKKPQASAVEHIRGGDLTIYQKLRTVPFRPSWRRKYTSEQYITQMNSEAILRLRTASFANNTDMKHTDIAGKYGVDHCMQIN
ncbi:hypothetical protein V495_06100 [Pseudogymnoascus sp. VKM F-4514 (FW-929)]|nr:hypothetical protein V495_06100 [Pseudogymnoascus sp. VKM F-4514 (FW-929)]KFY60238.1 hypothetical protein V497_03768 [Pseudogymnoascus sp. VKM F-4516 (FW-969)]